VTESNQDHFNSEEGDAPENTDCKDNSADLRPVIAAVVFNREYYEPFQSAVSLSSLDFTALFEHSPVPMAVLSYPDFHYVAANNLMVSSSGILLDEVIGNAAANPRTKGSDEVWLSEFRHRLDTEGAVKDLELKTHRADGSFRHLLLDGRFIQFDGASHILITGRDITEEKGKERNLRLLLEGMNTRLGDDWFRGAASALAELLDSEHVAIAEAEGGVTQRFSTHALLVNGEFSENDVFETPDSYDCPILKGNVVAYEDGVSTECLGAFPFLTESIRFFKGVPIENQNGQTIGAVLVASRKQRKVQKDHETIFKIIASRAAAEIERLRSDRAREAELQRTLLLQKISRALSQSLDPDQVLQIAVDQIGKVFQVCRCHIRRIEGENAPIIAEFCHDSVSPLKDVIAPNGKNQYSKDVILSENALPVGDTRGDERFGAYQEFMTQYGVKSILAARTSFGDRANGIVSMHQCGKQREWTPVETNLLEGIAAQIGVAIAQAELSEREKQQRVAMEEARELAESRESSKR